MAQSNAIKDREFNKFIDSPIRPNGSAVETIVSNQTPIPVTFNSGTIKIDYNEVNAVGLDTVTVIDKTIGAGLEVMASRVSFSGENRSIATIQINNEAIAKLRIYYANYNSAIDLNSFKLVSGDNIKIIVENKTNSNALFNASFIYSELTI